MNIIDGKFYSERILSLLEEVIVEKPMQLLIVTTGNDPASKVYIKSKTNACNRLHIAPIELHFGFIDKTALNRLAEYIADKDFPPFIIQLPFIGNVTNKDIEDVIVAKIIEKTKVTYNEAMEKFAIMDVDGILSTLNRVYISNPNSLIDYNINPLLPRYNIPCTPLGVLYLMRQFLWVHDEEMNFYYSNNPSVLILGRSDLVGKPLASILTAYDYTVSVAHSKTKKEDVLKLIDQSDIVISATGNPNTAPDGITDIDLSRKMLIDVGINRNPNVEGSKLVGDFSKDIATKFNYYTPVPGGVGPMTVAMLMVNVVKSYQYNFQENYVGAILPAYPKEIECGIFYKYIYNKRYS